MPAQLFVALDLGTDNLAGLAIPAVPDIASALMILALVGRDPSVAVRVLLPTGAVVGDLLAVTVIAVCHLSDLEPFMFLVAVVPSRFSPSW